MKILFCQHSLFVGCINFKCTVRSTEYYARIREPNVLSSLISKCEVRSANRCSTSQAKVLGAKCKVIEPKGEARSSKDFSASNPCARLTTSYESNRSAKGEAFNILSLMMHVKAPKHRTIHRWWFKCEAQSDGWPYYYKSNPSAGRKALNPLWALMRVAKRLDSSRI